MAANDAPPRRARVLLVGDSGVGKSILVRRLQRHLAAASGATAAISGAPAGLPPPTVGVQIEAAMLPGGAGGAVEFVDVGGNRGFAAATRTPCYHEVDGVIFVHRDLGAAAKTTFADPATAASSSSLFTGGASGGGDFGGAGDSEDAATLRSLYFWAEELRAAGVLPAVPFLVVGTALRRGPAAGSPQSTARATPLSPSPSPSSPSPGPGAAAALLAPLRVARGLAARATLLALSFALFGPAQTAVPLVAPPADIAAYFASLGGGGGGGASSYRGAVRGVGLDDDGAFAARGAEEVCEFIAALASRGGGSGSSSRAW